jgi:hypothetical protein
MDALATLGREQRDHVVARLDERYPFPDLGHDTGAFVAKHTRGVPAGVSTAGGVQIGMAYATSVYLDEHLPHLGGRQVDVLDNQRLAELLEDGGTHSHRFASLMNPRGFSIDMI